MAMQVIHNDASSIHLAGDGMTAALIGQTGGVPPELVLSRLMPGSVPRVLFSGSLEQARRITDRHKYAPAVRAFLARYVGSGAIDAYRAAHSTERTALTA